MKSKLTQEIEGLSSARKWWNSLTHPEKSEVNNTGLNERQLNGGEILVIWRAQNLQTV